MKPFSASCKHSWVTISKQQGRCCWLFHHHSDGPVPSLSAMSPGIHPLMKHVSEDYSNPLQNLDSWYRCWQAGWMVTNWTRLWQSSVASSCWELYNKILCMWDLIKLHVEQNRQQPIKPRARPELQWCAGRVDRVNQKPESRDTGEQIYSGQWTEFTERSREKLRGGHLGDHQLTDLRPPPSRSCSRSHEERCLRSDRRGNLLRIDTPLYWKLEI